MRVLYFASVDFYAKPNPSFHLMQTMISDLLEEGFEIEFVGCAQQGIEKHIPDEIERAPSFNYHLVDVPMTPKSSFVKRYIDGIVYAHKAQSILKLVLKKCDCVFIQSSPTVVYNISAARRIDKRIPIIYNIQDMFPGSSIASGIMPQKWIQNVFYSLQKIAYKESDVMVVISEDMKKKLIEQEVPEDKIHVIVNWFDDTTVHEVKWEDNRFVNKYHLSRDVFYAQYAGTMGYVFDYEMVLKVAQLLKPYDDIVIQMIGEGSQKEAFASKAKEKNLNNIAFLPLEPQNMVSDVYSACTVCLIPLKQGVIGNSVPSKAGLLMACKRPIISSVDAGSDYANMINDNRIGIAVDNNNVQGVVDAILMMRANPTIAVDMGRRGYQYGHDSYSRTNNMRKYIELFNDVILGKDNGSLGFLH